MSSRAVMSWTTRPKTMLIVETMEGILSMLELQRVSKGTVHGTDPKDQWANEMRQFMAETRKAGQSDGNQQHKIIHGGQYNASRNG